MKSKQSQMISKVLSSAVQLWLRSQVEQVENLKLNIEAGDRQILQGKIPSISLKACKAIYQGLHLSQIQLTAQSIGINLPQVLRGKPLHLLEPIPVYGQLQLESEDLNASVESPLLITALTDLLDQLLAAGGILNPAQQLKDWQLHWQKLDIQAETLKISGTLVDPNGYVSLVEIDSGLQLASPQLLRLYPLKIQTPPEFPVINLESFEFDLGSDVAIEDLSLTSGLLTCKGRITVNP